MDWSHYSKAWVALVMALLTVLTVHFGLDFSFLTEEVIVAIIGIIGTIAVWLIPNRD